MPQEASEDHEAQGRAMLEAAMEGIAERTRTGNSYPYDALDVVESDYYYGSVAAPGLIRISQKYSWFMGEDDSAEDRAQATAACKAETARLVDVSGF